MGVIGIQTLTYGVADLGEAERFWTDFGLKRAGERPLRLETANGSGVELHKSDDPALPPAVGPEPTAREVTWAVESEGDLERIAAALGLARETDGSVRVFDPTGYAMRFARSRLRPMAPAEMDYNQPGNPQRVDRRGKIYSQAEPRYLSHVVFKTPDLDAAVPFYTDRLGFKLTDCYPGQGYFLRAGASTDHHNLFLLKVGEDTGFHHVAFELRDLHELFGGGLAMAQKGWATHLGPGRHPISSCYFWYFKNPCGGAAEYDFDSDHVTDDWQPREWPRVPEAFAEWALESGMQLYGGVQTGSV